MKKKEKKKGERKRKEERRTKKEERRQAIFSTPEATKLWQHRPIPEAVRFPITLQCHKPASLILMTETPL